MVNLLSCYDGMVPDLAGWIGGRLLVQRCLGFGLKMPLSSLLAPVGVEGSFVQVSKLLRRAARVIIGVARDLSRLK